MSDILEEAETLLVQLPDAVARRKFGTQLGQATNELKTANAEIARMKALLELVEVIGYGELPPQREVINDMVELARSIGKLLEDADSADSLRLATFDYANHLRSAIVALDRAVREHWRKEAAEKFQPLVTIGRLLSAMNVGNDLGPRLVACGEEGLASANSGMAIDLLRRIQQVLTEHKALQDERSIQIGDDEVGEFIKALADNRATLAMVTDKVHAWLAKQNALATLKVTTR